MVNDADLKAAIKLVSDALMLGSEVAGGLSFDEIRKVIALVQELPPVLKSIGVMVPEYKALDDEARADLTAYVMANVKFPSNLKVETIVEQALTVIISLSSVIQAFFPVAPVPPVTPTP